VNATIEVKPCVSRQCTTRLACRAVQKSLCVATHGPLTTPPKGPRCRADDDDGLSIVPSLICVNRLLAAQSLDRSSDLMLAPTFQDRLRSSSETGVAIFLSPTRTPTRESRRQPAADSGVRHPFFRPRLILPRSEQTSRRKRVGRLKLIQSDRGKVSLDRRVAVGAIQPRHVAACLCNRHWPISGSFGTPHCLTGLRTVSIISLLLIFVIVLFHIRCIHCKS